MRMSIKNLSRTVLGICTKLSWLGPLVIRLALGVVFVTSGWGKLHNLDDVIGFFKDLHIPLAGPQAVFVSTVELVGGIAVIVGLGTRIASALLIGVMTVAILTAKLDDIHGVLDFAKTEEVHYLLMFVWLLVAGAGKASLDHLLFRRRSDPQVGEAA